MIARIPDELKKLKNVHVEELQAMIVAEDVASYPVPDNMRFIFICYTNRCGSNYVAQLLASTGHFNLAGEFFNHDTVKTHAARQGFESVSRYLGFLCNQVAKNGVLICKLAATHLMLLSRAGILNEILPRSQFVSVERNDRLSQAVSLAIATQTKQWTSTMTSRISSGDLVFRKSQIDSIIESTVQQQSALASFFGMNGVDYFTINYEQVSQEPELYIGSMCRWLGVDVPPVQRAKIQIQRQASDINSMWRGLYLGQS